MIAAITIEFIIILVIMTLTRAKRMIIMHDYCNEYTDQYDWYSLLIQPSAIGMMIRNNNYDNIINVSELFILRERTSLGHQSYCNGIL